MIIVDAAMPIEGTVRLESLFADSFCERPPCSASYLPARCAARVDPMTALREA